MSSTDRLHADRLHLDGVVALLGAFPALSGLSLVVRSPQVVVVRGPNGAGKSTLLNVCAGLVTAQRGTVRVLGSDLRVDRQSVRRHLGYLGHKAGLYDDLTVEQHVRLAARAAGVAVSVVGPTLARVGLDGRLARLGCVHLSAGQRRRVALAALIVRQVPLWLLDEPHAALDSDGRDLLDGVIRDAASTGTTILLASHDQERANGLADRVVTIVGGRVISDEHIADRVAAPLEVAHVS
jgi:heme ABC exporter ATP-binding subunit CcmA